MNKQIRNFFIFLSIFFFNFSESQEYAQVDLSESVKDIFSEVEILPIKMSYSIKNIRRETNDSTYIDSQIEYQVKDGNWEKLPVELRKRGNNRLKNCFFPPLKVKVKKSDVKKTPFEGHKNFKIVLPCLLEKDNNDNVVKEYLVYKLFEVVSPYHFKARLLNIEFEDIRGGNNRSYELKGILTEDDKHVAKRFDGKVYERSMHPLNQEPLSSIRNAFFQFMIGNTDFSTAYQHNIKVIYINKEMIPIPFDFDMSGFINTSYAAASIHVNSVTERKYRGFVRDKKLFEQVRQEFIDNKEKLLAVLDDNALYFDNQEELIVAREYILSFYEILVNNQKFKKEILDQARTDK